METRLLNWYKEMTSQITEKELAEGICNGDVSIPLWLSYSPTTSIGFAIWDNENSNGTTRLIGLEID